MTASFNSDMDTLTSRLDRIMKDLPEARKKLLEVERHDASVRARNRIRRLKLEKRGPFRIVYPDRRSRECSGSERRDEDEATTASAPSAGASPTRNTMKAWKDCPAPPEPSMNLPASPDLRLRNFAEVHGLKWPEEAGTNAQDKGLKNDD